MKNNHECLDWLKIVEQGDIYKIDEILKNNRNFVFETDDEDTTALMFVAERGNYNLVKLLLDNGANIESRNNIGGTALMIATMREKNDVVELLLDKGADIEARTNNGGNTLLLIASIQGKSDVVKFLLDKGVDIEARNNIGNTALIFATIEGQYNIVRLLLDKGADIEAKNNDGATALMFAAVKRKINIARLLLDRGANIEAKSNIGNTALLIAATQGKADVIKFLLDNGADIEAGNNEGSIELILSNDILFGPFNAKVLENTIKLLVKFGARPFQNMNFKLAQDAFDEALKENPNAMINICKYYQYTKYLKLYDKNSINTKNLIEFIYTYKNTKNLDLITESFDRQVHDLYKTIVTIDDQEGRENILLNSINTVLNSNFDIESFRVGSDGLKKALMQKYYSQSANKVEELLLDVVNIFHYDEQLNPCNFYKRLLSHLEVPIKTTLPNKLTIILNNQISNDKSVSLGIATLNINNEKKYKNISKIVFEKSDIVNLIIRFVGFDNGFGFYSDLVSVVQNIKWSTADILSLPSLKNLESVKIINTSENIIDIVGKFYKDIQDSELDMILLKKNIFSYDCQKRPAFKDLSFLSDIYGTRKFEDFIYLKGLAKTLNIRIEFYSQEYGLASFGRDINDYVLNINIYEIKQKEYIISGKRRETSNLSKKRSTEHEEETHNWNKKMKTSSQDLIIINKDSILNSFTTGFNDEDENVIEIRNIVAVYDNPLLNNQKLLQEADKYSVTNQLIDLGSDREVAIILIDAANEYGAEKVIHTIFSINTMPIQQQLEIGPLPSALVLICDNTNKENHHQSHTSSPMTNQAGAITLLTARDVLESGPTLKYFANEILHLNITTPEMGNNAWASIHFALGSTAALSLSIASSGDISPISAISAAAMSSATYAARTGLYENMNQYTKESGLLATISAQIALSLVNGAITKAMMPNLGYSALAYDMAIFASIGGMKYYQANYLDYNQEKSTFEIIIPYAADAITMFILAGNINIPTNNAISYMMFTKQALAAVSTIVTVDYMTKMTMNMVSDYIDANYLNEFLSSFSNYFYGNEAKDTENFESVIETKYIDLDSYNLNMMGETIKEELVEVIEL